ncbi:UNVERIFIED_CONTAM: hypothetical protein FKN15_058828 [Acipenser sinensis]
MIWWGLEAMTGTGALTEVYSNWYPGSASHTPGQSKLASNEDGFSTRYCCLMSAVTFFKN